VAELTEDLKTELVLRLARFKRPADIARWLKADHDITIELAQVVAYDPTKATFRVGEKWRVIFDAARDAYLYEVSKVPIAQQGFRLNTLNDMLRDALQAKNRGQALNILEQAAKEVGGLFSNVRVPIPGQTDGNELNAEERREKLAGIIDSALHPPKPNAPSSPAAQ
jgi:hypothetical protein